MVTSTSPCSPIIRCSFIRLLQLILAIVLGLSMLPPAGPAYALDMPIPVVSLDTPKESFIGQQFSFTASFDNAGGPGDVGYGPYIDLIFPYTGIDGYDGISFVKATYLGLDLTSSVLTFQDNGLGVGEAAHPYAKDSLGQPVIITGTIGDQLVVLQLPFGSFTYDQPPVVASVTAFMTNTADVSVPLTITAQGGFMYGYDPLDNPKVDPSIIGSPVTKYVTPTLLTLTKTYHGPENETASGPNFERQYTINVDIANGQPIQDLLITDTLPNNLQFLQVDSASVHGATINASEYDITTTADMASVPGGTVMVHFHDVITGSLGSNDAAMVFSFYVPLSDTLNAAVIDPLSGDDVYSPDDAKAGGDWTPVDVNDPLSHVVTDANNPDHVLTDKSIAIQKGVRIASDVVPSGATPGDILEYTLDFQVSDFFAFQGVVISDTFSDGQHFDYTFTPTLQINGNPGWTLPAQSFSSTNYVVDISDITTGTVPGAGGTTRLSFFISAEMITRGQDGKLIGGCVPAAGTGSSAPLCSSYNDGGTSGQIKFRTMILDKYSDDYPSGNASLNQGDALNNTVIVTGSLLSVADTAVLNGTDEADGSSAAVVIAQGTLQKSIYAVNGELCSSNPGLCTLPVQIAPLDTITYRLKYNLILGDFEKLRFTDYLPLPVLRADDPDADGSAGPEFTFYSGPDLAPPAGQWMRGPDDTVYTHSVLVGTLITPTVVVTAAANSVQFNLGTFDDPHNESLASDLLFTVAARSDPFADGLFLTNQVRQQDQNTENQAAYADAIVQIQLTEPVILKIYKGAVASDNPFDFYLPAPPVPLSDTVTSPGSAGFRLAGDNIPVNTLNLGSALTRTFDSDVQYLDGGDKVTFALVIENAGRSRKGAFDIIISDTLPAGLSIPVSGLNLNVSDGNGSAIAYVNAPGSSGLFAGGIELVDSDIITGALKRGINPDESPVTDGSNIAIITFDLQLINTITATTRITNTATISNYSNLDGSENFISTPLTDTATVTTKQPALAKDLTGHSQPETNLFKAAVGEVFTYTLEVAVPEGVLPNTKITDTLDATGAVDLAFVACSSITPSAGVTTDQPGGFDSACTSPQVETGGGQVTFDLGTLTNINDSNLVTETLTLVYRAVVVNTSDNQRGAVLANSAVLSWDNGVVVYITEPVTAPDLTVVEPTLELQKSSVPSQGDAGDPITFTLTNSHAPSSDAPAFNTVLTDAIPAGMGYIPGSLALVSGLPPDGLSDAGGETITATWNIFPLGSTSVISFQARLDNSVQPGQIITNTAIQAWTSLSGQVTSTQTPYNNFGVERTGSSFDPGDPSGAINDYLSSAQSGLQGQSAIEVNNLAPVKTLQATSEAHTINAFAAVGEVARFRLVSTLPEAVIPNLTLTDELPAGLAFLNDGTAKIALVSSDPLRLTSSLLSGPGLNQVGDETNVDTITPSFLITPTGGSGSLFSFGADPVFSLGDIVNNDDDASQEFLVLEFNALVGNLAANQAGTELVDRIMVQTGSPLQDLVASTTATLTVAEPSLAFTKTRLNSPVDAGDYLTYTLLLTNTASGVSRAAAFNLVVSDTLDSFLELAQVDIASPAATVDHSTLGAGGLVSITLDRLDPAEDISGSPAVWITVTARLAADIPAGLTVSNRGEVTYTSLPGEGGTTTNPTGSVTPGNAGEQSGERSGADGPGGALNDYAANGNAAVFTLNTPVFDKLPPTPSQFTIGDVITYYLKATLPEGKTRDLVITDTLETGLGFLDAQPIIQVASSQGLLTADYGGSLPAPSMITDGRTSGTGVTLSFGDVTTTDDNQAGNNAFLVRVRARVLNETANQRPGQRRNWGSLQYTNPNTGSLVTVNDPPVTITLIEPQITSAKLVTPSGNVQAGTLLTYTVYFTNTGDSTAYNLVTTDTLAADTAYANNLACTINGLPVNYLATPGSGQVVFQGLAAGDWTLPVNQAIICSYNAYPQDTLYVNGSYTNTIDADWSSQADINTPENRTYDDQGLYTVDASQDSAQSVFQVPGLGFSKTASASQAAVGEVVTYTLTVTSPTGTVDDLQLRDVLPAGLLYNNWYDVSGTSVSPVFTQTGSGPTTLEWAWAGAPAADALITPTNQIVIRYTATVANISGNQAGTALTNNARLDYKNAAGVSQTTQTSSRTVTVLEPAVSLAKTISASPTPADAGGLVGYRAVISNPAGANVSPAYNLVLTDTLPAQLGFNNASWVSSGGAGGIVSNTLGRALTVTVDLLPPGGYVTVSYTATLNVSVNPNQVINNTARAAWTSQPDASAQERTGTDGPGGTLNDYAAASSRSFTTILPSIAKSLQTTSEAHTTNLGGTERVAVGEIIRYHLVVSLTEGTTPRLVITDVLPSGLIFLQDGSVKAALVSSNVVSLTSSTLPSPDINAVGANASVVPTYTLPAGAIENASSPGQPFANGHDVRFLLGNITNSDNDSDLEYAVVEFNALVENLSAVISDTQLTNSASVGMYNGSVTTTLSTSGNVSVRVAEPVLSATKAQPTTPLDAGDYVTYTLVITNIAGGNNRAAAFNIAVTDTLASYLDLLQVDTLGPLTATVDGSASVPGPGGTVIVSINPLLPSVDLASGPRSALITVTARVIASAPAQQVITNTAWATYTSLPGENGTSGNPTGSTTPGFPATATGERTGQNGTSLPNKYTTSANVVTATLAVPAIAKLPLATPYATIGELVTYTLVVTLPEGVTRGLEVGDAVPGSLAGSTGLDYEGYTLITQAADSGGLLSADYSGGSLSPAVIGGNGVGAGVKFVFGNVTTTDDNNPANNSFLLKVWGRVYNLANNQAGLVLNNTATLSYTHPVSGSPVVVSTPAVPLTITEPTLSLGKVISGLPAPADNGGEIAYRLAMTNTAGATASTAYDLVFTDTLPGQMDLTAVDYDPASGATGVSVQRAGNALTVTAVTLPPGASLAIYYTATLNTSVAPNQIITNNGRVAWTSRPEAELEERDGSGGINDYFAAASNQFTAASLSAAKSVSGYSENDPAGPNVAVGEVIRYRLKVNLIEGSHANLALVDNLPADLLLLTDTVKVAFVSDDTGAITSSALSGAGLNVSGDENAAITPAFALDPAYITGSTFSLGTVVNAESDSNQELVLLDFNALVRNNTNNQAGQVRTNSFTVQVNGSTPPGGSSNSSSVTVVEPAVLVSKQLLNSPQAAGDYVTYTLRVTNTAVSNRGPAYDLVVSDTLNAYLKLLQVDITTPDGAMVTDTSDLASWGGTLNVALDKLSPAADITGGPAALVITATARLKDTTPAGQTITNSAAAVYTSLPGSNGTPGNSTGQTAPGEAGSANGERSGQDGPGGLNDYAASSGTPLFTLTTPQFDKLELPAPARYTIGDIVTYTLVVTLPEGVTRGLVVTDTLETGLGYLDYTVITAASQGEGLLSADYNGSLAAPLVITDGKTTGTGVSFSFGDTTTSDDGLANNNAFLLRLRARVMNETANQQGLTRRNWGSLHYTNPNTGNTVTVNDAPVTLLIIEPQITSAKAVSPSGSVEAGTLLTYTAYFTNTGDSPAYGVTVLDTLATSTAYAGSLACTKNGTPVNSTASLLTGQVLFAGLTDGDWDLPVGQAIACTYNAVPQDAISINGTYTNTVNADWRSQSNPLTPENRTYADQGTYTVDQDQDFARTAFSINGVVLSKSDGGLAQAAVGQEVAYTLTVTTPLGTIRGLAISDTLPAGMVYQDGSQAVSGVTSVFTFTVSTPNDGSLPVILNWTFNDAVVTPTQPVRLAYTAIVANVISNQTGQLRSNNAVLDYQDAAGQPQPRQAVSDGLAVAEPAITLAKTILNPPAPADAGNSVGYQVLLQNLSGANTSPAYDLVFTDTLPAELALNAATLAPSGLGSLLAEGNSLTVTIPVLNPGESLTVNYTATLASSIAPQAIISNTARVFYTSRPGQVAAERTGTDGPGGTLNDYAAASNQSFTSDSPQISKALLSTSAGHTDDNDLAIGEVVTYSLAVTLPEGTISSLVITDQLPDGLAYVTGSVAVDKTGFGGTLPDPAVSSLGGSGDNVAFTFGATTVNADNNPTNNVFTITLQARLLDELANVGLPGSQSHLDNTASLQAGSLPEITANTVTADVVEPQLIISKMAAPTATEPNTTVTFTLVVTNTGLARAFDVIVTDPLTEVLFANPAEVNTPPGFTYNTASAGGITTITYTGGDIEVGGAAIFTFTATAGPTGGEGYVLTNTARVSQVTTLPGMDPGERYEPPASAQAEVTLRSSDLALAKTDFLGEAQPNQVLTYTLAVTNTGLGTAFGATLTETVPVYTVFQKVASSPGWSCAENAPAGTLCTLALGDLGPGASLSRTFVVQVVNPIPTGAMQIVNDALVNDNGLHGADPTPADNSAQDVDTLRLASVGNFAWEDLDMNGQQDGGEPGINNIDITLVWAGPDGLFGTADDHTYITATNGSGWYSLGGLPSGAYSVTFGLPGGYFFTQAGSGSVADPASGQYGFALAAGEARTDVDSGLYRLGAVGNFVWNDANANGLQDSSETGIPSVTVTLFTSSGAYVSSTLTGPTGYYTFTGLVPGDYTLVFTTTAGYTFTLPRLGGSPALWSDPERLSGQTPVFSMASNQTDLDHDAGLYQPAALGDLVWVDTDGDGVYEGEPGFAGVTITATWAGPDGSFATGDDLVYTITTDAGGAYHLTELPPGSYRVAFERPADYTFSPQGGNSQPDPSTGLVEVTLAQGEINNTVDAGLYRLLMIGNLVWEDLNGNGLQDIGEPGISDIPVTLLNSSGEPVSTTITGPTGNYTFTNQPAGDYTLLFTPTLGYTFTFHQQGSDAALWSDPYTDSGRTAAFTAAAGGEYLNHDAGMFQPASLGDYVWLDLDGNGLYQPGSETGVSGVPITLTYAGLDGVFGSGDDRVYTTAAAPDGSYNFTLLPPGTYSVTFGLPDGYAFSPQGGDSLPNPSTGQVSVTLVSGQNRTDVDAGLSNLDYGDLPNSDINPSYHYAVTLAEDGARHSSNGLVLGSGITADTDGKPGLGASADQQDTGIILYRGDIWEPGATVHLSATVSGGDGWLVAWFDWNRDGDFEDADEQVNFGQVVSGTHALPVQVGTGYLKGESLYARFRLFATDPGASPLPGGQAVGGEVEDYQFLFKATSIRLVDFQAHLPQRSFLRALVEALQAYLLP